MLPNRFPDAGPGSATIVVKIGATSMFTVSTISSDGHRFGVCTHSFAAPYIAQLAVVAIISPVTEMGKPLVRPVRLEKV